MDGSHFPDLQLCGYAFAVFAPRKNRSRSTFRCAEETQLLRRSLGSYFPLRRAYVAEMVSRLVVFCQASLRVLLSRVFWLATWRSGYASIFGFRFFSVHSVRIPKVRYLALMSLSGLASVARFVQISARDGSDIQEREFSRGILLYLQDSLDRQRLYHKAANWPGKLVFIGGRDLTMPRQVDTRWGPSEPIPPVLLAQLETGAKKLFVENLDDTSAPLHPIPGGVLPTPILGAYRFAKVVPFADVRNKSGVLLCSHRIRQGPQWELRKEVTQIAESQWSDFATVEAGLSRREFNRQASKHLFGLCVEGGGVSPAPKFFDLLLRQCIPVVVDGPLASVYSELPCVVVSRWSAEVLSADFLASEHDRLRGEWRDWGQVYERMSLDWWVDYVKKA